MLHVYNNTFWKTNKNNYLVTLSFPVCCRKDQISTGAKRPDFPLSALHLRCVQWPQVYLLSCAFILRSIVLVYAWGKCPKPGIRGRLWPQNRWYSNQLEMTPQKPRGWPKGHRICFSEVNWPRCQVHHVVCGYCCGWISTAFGCGVRLYVKVFPWEPNKKAYGILLDVKVFHMPSKACMYVRIGKRERCFCLAELNAIQFVRGECGTNTIAHLVYTSEWPTWNLPSREACK